MALARGSRTLGYRADGLTDPSQLLYIPLPTLLHAEQVFARGLADRGVGAIATGEKQQR